MSTTYFQRDNGTLSSTRTKTSSGLSFNQYFGGGSDFWRARSSSSSIKFTSFGVGSFGISSGRSMTYHSYSGSRRRF